jgi:predicted cupin superfamily sugar epimerase
MPSPRARALIRQLGLVPHPERGYYAETYRAPVAVGAPTHPGPRAASTAIYFLLTDEERSSRLHRLRSDELFHLYEGGPLEVLLLAPDGSVRVETLGLDLEAGARPQLVIPAGTWFGTELPAGVGHCLWGCTVAPGFEFADFELADGPALEAQYPAAAGRIRRLTSGG